MKPRKSIILKISSAGIIIVPPYTPKELLKVKITKSKCK